MGLAATLLRSAELRIAADGMHYIMFGLKLACRLWLTVVYLGSAYFSRYAAFDS